MLNWNLEKESIIDRNYQKYNMVLDWLIVLIYSIIFFLKKIAILVKFFYQLEL